MGPRAPPPRPRSSRKHGTPRYDFDDETERSWSFAASMPSSSSTLPMVIAQRRFPNLASSIVHSLNAEILSSDPISYSGVSQQPLGGNHPGLPAEATRSADPLGGLLNNNGIDSVEKQPDSGSVRDPNESDERDEWLTCLVNGDLDDIITADITSDYPQMDGSAPVSSSLNSETWPHEHIVHQLISVPTIPEQLHPTVSPPATINFHSPQRTRVRRRWTREMHDRFRDAVNQLGGGENAKPKAILEIMNVEGLTRDQVKSHLQIHRSILENHVMSLHELEDRQNLNTDRRTVHLPPSPPPPPPPAPPFSSSVNGGSRMMHGEGSSTAALDDDGHASEAGSLGNNEGA
ncbi:hypothetical protein BAE44_0011395 [Dichanthelium oligosanthes]|uniref:HTH myb-type domain-containing protein n=1 Tax=Dichanthelium oligosanthes TaxID=888268 RepID=A0A1E5VR27_9POAL|nr:hypothetical protein BAE44_0011395 [Dichanthelium oligosanthes]